MLKITIDIAASTFQVHLVHECLHPPPSNHSVLDFVKILLEKILIAKFMLSLFPMEWI